MYWRKASFLLGSTRAGGRPLVDAGRICGEHFASVGCFGDSAITDQYLGIGFGGAHSFAPIGGALRERRHRCRQIDPNNCTVRRDSLGKFQNNLTPATAYVEDALTKVRHKRRQSAPTKRSEL